MNFKSIETMDIESLAAIVNNYHYGKTHITDGKTGFATDWATGRLILTNYLRFSERQGECAELTAQAYKDLHRHHPDLWIMRANGNEPRYFQDTPTTITNHQFVLIAQKNPIGDLLYTEDFASVEMVAAANPIVFDPSLKIVAPLSETRYSIKQVFNPGCEVTYEKTLALGHGHAVPVGMTKKGSIICITAHFSLFGPPVKIGYQEEGRDRIDLKLDSPELAEVLRDEPQLENLVDFIGKQPFYDIKGRMPASEEVVIG